MLVGGLRLVVAWRKQKLIKEERNRKRERGREREAVIFKIIKWVDCYDRMKTEEKDK